MVEADRVATNPNAEIVDDNEHYLRYGPFTESDYEYPDIPQQRLFIEQISAKFDPQNPEKKQNRIERIQMWQNYDELVSFISEKQPQTIAELDELITVYLTDEVQIGRVVSPFAFGDYKGERKASGNTLAAHLLSVSHFAKELLIDNGDVTRFPGLLSKRQCQLMIEVIPQMHDKLKYLGGLNAQIMRDHEIMAAHFLAKALPGLRLSDGTSMSDEDTAFVVGIVGDHENIYREENRTDNIDSHDPIVRGKAIFFLIDVLTNCFDEAELRKGHLVLNEDEFESRFIDLDFRHIDKVKGKTFRPQWGAFAIADISHILTVLQAGGGLRVESSLFDQLKEGASKAIVDALKANDARVDNTFSEIELEEIAEAQKAIERL